MTDGTHPAGRVHLRCTVRECGEILTRSEDRWVCPRGHSFDVSRTGFVNLLQPQDKKADLPGDSKEVVAARRRLLDAGVAAPLSDAVRDLASGLPAAATVLDVGCGEGTHLAAACVGGREGWGVDISTAAIEAAVKRHRDLGWVVANADRGLPFGDASFALALSITGRRDPGEIARVLAPGGSAVIAVPAPDDLAELRQAVQGEAIHEDRMEKIVGEFEPHFIAEGTLSIANRVTLDPDALRDALAVTYRGARNSERERSTSLTAMAVTFSWQVGIFLRR